MGCLTLRTSMGLNVKHVELKAPAGALGGAWTAALGCARARRRGARGPGAWPTLRTGRTPDVTHQQPQPEPFERDDLLLEPLPPGTDPDAYGDPIVEDVEGTLWRVRARRAGVPPITSAWLWLVALVVVLLVVAIIAAGA